MTRVRLPRRRVRPPDAQPPAPPDPPGGDAPGEVPAWRMGIVVAMIVGMLAALVWVVTLDPPPQTTSIALPQASTAATVSAAPSPAAVFTPPDKPPPSLDGLLSNDWRTVVETYFAYHRWLAEHPHPELLDNITHPECECYAEDLELLTAYRQLDAWWIYEADTVVHSVEEIFDPVEGHPGEQMPSGSQLHSVHLKVITGRSGGGRLVDESGRIHVRVDPVPKEVYDVVFVRQTLESPWKLRTIIYGGEVDARG